MDINWPELIIRILPGLATSIVLVIKLIQYIQKYTKEKNWPEMLDFLMDLMKTAEDKFENGADRKQWVMAMMKAAADQLNYDLNMDVISEMIDSMCDMANVVNVQTNNKDHELADNTTISADKTTSGEEK